MGEAKEEEAKPAEAKPEEKKEEKAEEKAEEKKEEAKPSPPQPTVLFVDLHCLGCAKKIQRSILKCRGVEEVEVDMVKNELKVKGVVDPQALCSRIQKKTMRMAKVISPLPPADNDTTKEVAAAVSDPSQVSGLSTVELHVNMHCEACAQQLRRKILKMRGVQAVETDISARKITVTGTMTGDKIVEYIHRRTGKLAKVIPPPPPPPPPEEEKKSEEKPPEEKKDEKPEEKKEEKAEEKKEEEKPAPQEQANAEVKGGGEEQKKEEGQANFSVAPYMYGGGMVYDEKPERMVQWLPIYVMERPPMVMPPPMMMPPPMPHLMPPPQMMMPPPMPQLMPPPQMFSDENPNACCIS